MMGMFGMAVAALVAAGAFSTTAAQDVSTARMDVTPPAFDEAESEAARIPKIPKGTEIRVTLDENIPVRRDRLGDTFEGHIART
jgi:hypothetical protein